ALLREAEANIKAAKAAVDFRTLQLERLQKLVATGAVDQKVLDEGRLAADTAKANLAGAEAKLLGAQAAWEESTARGLQAEASVKVAEAQLVVSNADFERVQIQLSYSKLQAPFDGVVLHRNVTTGDLIQGGPVKGKPILVVARTDILRVVVELPE